MSNTRALFEAYLATLEGRDSHRQAVELLAEAAEVLGAMQPGEVRPTHIVQVLRPIHRRRAPVSADKARAFMSAAFRWGMRAANDYTVDAGMDWGLESNPVAAVPRDASSARVGTRWLDEDEFQAFLRWARARRCREPLLVLALTGQRAREILRMRAEQWDEAQGLVYWPTTKTKVPHCIPVVPEVAAILSRRAAAGGGWMFPATTVRGRPVPDGTARQLLRYYVEKAGVRPFTPRDLRRTWKTLAGKAGLSREVRDALQNHARSDVASRHYDRYDGLPEKRAGVALWGRWLSVELGEADADQHAQQVVDPQQHAEA